MSLIEDIKLLTKLEQKATPGKWLALEDAPGSMVIISNPKHPIWNDGLDAYGEKEASEKPDAKYITESRNLAPAMLSVLACFHDGDAETLGEILDVFQFDGEPMSAVYADCISRLQKAASLMEDE